MRAEDRPVYHLKGVVKAGAAAAEDFVGPLDLILHLLQKNRVAIQDISLTEVLEQFLAWMEARRAIDLEVAGEFIAMASHLMLLKTKMLLSAQDREAKEEMAALIASLEARQRQEERRRVQAVLPQLTAGWTRGRACFPKGPEAAFARRVYRYQQEPGDLLGAIAAWRARCQREAPPDPASFEVLLRSEPYPVEEKAAQLLSLLAEGPLHWRDLLCRSGSRAEATASFLALLELCRAGKVCLTEEMDDPEITRSSAQ